MKWWQRSLNPVRIDSIDSILIGSGESSIFHCVNFPAGLCVNANNCLPNETYDLANATQ